MPSPLLVGLRSTLDNLKGSFIGPTDAGNVYSSAEHDRALGYRVLCAAAIEDFIEQRVSNGAREGVDRFLKQQPTRTGRSLLVWHIATRSIATLPIKETEQLPDRDLMTQALEAFEKRVKSTHGANRKDVRNLVFPIGVQSSAHIEALFDKLQSFADARDPAVHVRVNRARLMVPPDAEVSQVSAIVADLAHLDDAIEQAVTLF